MVVELWSLYLTEPGSPRCGTGIFPANSKHCLPSYLCISCVCVRTSTLDAVILSTDNTNLFVIAKLNSKTQGVFPFYLLWIYLYLKFEIN